MAFRHVEFHTNPGVIADVWRQNRGRTLALSAGFVLGTTIGVPSAQAALTISADSTSHVTCSAGVCVPTAVKAVLNVKDLEKLLASGNVTVTTTGSGVQADDIDIAAGLTWASSVSLSLDAYQSIAVTASVSVKGSGGMSLQTNSGGTAGTLSFGPKGRIQFKNLSSALSINGTPYTLVDSVAALASAVEKNTSGAYAFARAYDASKDGTYSASPVSAIFAGSFEGLGNTISNLSINDPTDFMVGLFLENQGTIADAVLSGANVSASSSNGELTGTLVGENEGTVQGSRATGSVTVSDGTAGGLIGCECFAVGTITNSSADVTVFGSGDVSLAGGLLGSDIAGSTITASSASGSVSGGPDSYLGGLSGVVEGSVATSYATGAVSSPSGSVMGGLAGNSSGAISNSYATGAVSGDTGDIGGFVGQNFGTIAEAYSTGAVGGSGDLGGLIGDDGSSSGSISNSYWDTTTSGITNLDQGAGNIPNDPGITGLTTKQLQSGLPTGFSKKIWKESGKRNGGLPYLIANPPP